MAIFSQQKRSLLMYASISVFLAALLFILAAPVVVHADNINLSIAIPKPGGGQVTQVSGLGEYIKLLYQYGVMISGILAAFMILFYGLEWMESAGNASKVEKAKEAILSAIIGLVLAFGSYGLLYLINPNLVVFQPLTLTNVEGRTSAAQCVYGAQFDCNATYDMQNNAPVASTAGICQGTKCANGLQVCERTQPSNPALSCQPRTGRAQGSFCMQNDECSSQKCVGNYCQAP